MLLASVRVKVMEKVGVKVRVRTIVEEVAGFFSGGPFLRRDLYHPTVC